MWRYTSVAPSLPTSTRKPFVSDLMAKIRCIVLVMWPKFQRRGAGSAFWLYQNTYSTTTTITTKCKDSEDGGVQFGGFVGVPHANWVLPFQSQNTRMDHPTNFHTLGVTPPSNFHTLGVTPLSSLLLTPLSSVAYHQHSEN